MNRIKNAWNVLIGRESVGEILFNEKAVEKEVIRHADEVVMFLTELCYPAALLGPPWPPWNRKLWRTCEDAFAAIGSERGGRVSKVRVLLTEDGTFEVIERSVFSGSYKLGEKPKIDKSGVAV